MNLAFTRTVSASRNQDPGFLLSINGGATGTGSRTVETEHLNDQPIEAALLAEIARGNAEAFSQFYDRLSGLLLGLAAKILGDLTAAEDVLQEVFVQIWEKAPTYDPALGKPLTWTVMLTRHKAIDRLRATQRRRRLVEEATQENETTVELATGSDDAAISQETAQRVRSALTALPAEQRQAIEMAFFGGLTQLEIAEAIPAPLGTVKARIRRGMLSLREALAVNL